MRRSLSLLLLGLLLVGCAARAVPDSGVRAVRVNGADLACRILGRGDPLLLVMGFGGTMDIWDPALVDDLARSHRVILFDHRNAGRSPESPGPVTVEGMACDALGLLRALGIGRAHVLGWSMGSMIAQEMALAEPEAVDKLVLYGTVCRPEGVRRALSRFEGVTHEQLLAMLFPKEWADAHPDVWSRLPSPAVPASAWAVARQREAMLAWPGARDRLGHIRSDTLVVAGEEDEITPVADGLDVAARIPGAWVARFRGAGHWLMYQSPGGLASAVTDFLSATPDLRP
ncbi:MAG: alpha/beta fold hydrolase [Pseudodesulfovibrio sp.]